MPLCCYSAQVYRVSFTPNLFGLIHLNPGALKSLCLSSDHQIFYKREILLSSKWTALRVVSTYSLCDADMCEFKRSEFDHGSPIAQDTFCPLFLVCTTAEKQPANIDNNNLCTQKWPVGLAWKINSYQHWSMCTN